VAGYLKKIMIIGNVGRDPETRYTQDGTPFSSFTMAVNDRPRRAQGQGQGTGGQQQEEQTTWFGVTAWRRQSEIVSQYVTKGMSLFVMGNLSVREAPGKDGGTRTFLDVNMEEMQILTPKGVQEGGSFDEGGSFGGGQQGAGRPSASYGGRAAAPSQPSGGRQQPDQGFGDDDDIPF